MAFENYDHHKLEKHFIKSVNGYHMINDAPIKEAFWEEINSEILEEAGYIINKKSGGSHKSGIDIDSSLGGFSNKSTMYAKNRASFKVSSYRLTTVCSNKNPGVIEDIIAKINSRKNFDSYSIIIREEIGKIIAYDWYIIPNDYEALNPASYTWTPLKGGKGKNKDAVIGWETNELNGSKMQISFSMSSQLWITVNVTEELQKYKVATCKITKGRKYNYSQLYDMLTTPIIIEPDKSSIVSRPAFSRQSPPPPPPSPESSLEPPAIADESGTDELAASLSQINLT